ncbi:MFS transporter [Acuticoccus yangtzensis]|uniref:MFS transporter n=1 Tax=Acuticoccus yangtzensis TaxID=1443441 RepID=UPI000949A903|nr:MFS transporter [Acuticoccus yangtzensis]
MKPNWTLLALAVGAFSIGTTEFTPMGLLPTIAAGVDVTIPTAGMLVTAYAVGVMVGAPVMTLALTRLRTKTALISLMAIFTVGNILSAAAPDFWTLMGARIVTSFNHGAFFGLGAVLATKVVPADKAGSAIATMFLGLTVANIGGVPLATALGNAIGWRATFAAIALLGLASMASLALALPRGAPGAMPDVRAELAVLTRPAVLNALATTVVGASAMFALYTYVTPTVMTLADASEGFVTVGLVLIGVGFTVGSHLSGKLADRSVDGTLVGFLAFTAAVLLTFPLVATTPAMAALWLFLFGIGAFGTVPPVQMRVMTTAAEAPGLASSINIGAFNLGNAIGAAAGGAVLSAGLGYAAIPIAASVFTLAGIALVLLAKAGRSDSRTATTAATG